MIEHERYLILQTLMYLDEQVRHISCPGEWNHVCSIISALEEHFEIERWEYVQEIELNEPLILTEEQTIDLGLC